MSFPTPDYLEGTIYDGGFPSYRDKDLMQEFHLSDDLEKLIKISRNFEDERFRLFAERIICTNYQGDIPEDILKRNEDLIYERTQTEGDWQSIDKYLIQIDKLLDEREDPEDINILNVTKEKLLSMKKK